MKSMSLGSACLHICTVNECAPFPLPHPKQDMYSIAASIWLAIPRQWKLGTAYYPLQQDITIQTFSYELISSNLALGLVEINTVAPALVMLVIVDHAIFPFHPENQGVLQWGIVVSDDRYLSRPSDKGAFWTLKTVPSVQNTSQKTRR
jgi:hypothetical protein